MAKPTERAIKRKPMAVIMLTTLRKDVPNVPTGQGGHEFEWFDTEEGMHAFFDQVHAFNQEDTKSHDDMAYLTVEITKTEDMSLGRCEVAPVTDETTAWQKSILADITKAFQPVKETSKDEEPKKAVRPRRKSSAAAAVQKGSPDKGETPETKAARLKERLAAKQPEKKSETGDEAPKPRARRAPAKATESKETDFVVKKAATAPADA